MVESNFQISKRGLLGAGALALFAAACERDASGVPSDPVAVPSPKSGPASISDAISGIPDADAAPPPAAQAPPPMITKGPSSDIRRPCPEEMAHVGDYCVDRYEAGLELIDSGLARPHPPQLRPQSDARYRAVVRAGERPQGYISRDEAAQACANADKRLCSATEWRRACQGAKRTRYPYGTRFEPSKCNVGKPHLLSLRFGSEPRKWKYDEHFNDPSLNLTEGFLAPAGGHPECVSEEGVFDMVGNLHEWVSDQVDRTLPSKVPLTDGLRRALPRNFGHGIFMGGFFSTTSEHGRGCDFVTLAHEPAYHDYSTGFRCCCDAREP